MLSPADALLVARMRSIGMLMPIRTLLAARAEGLAVPLACSIVMQETGGGRNEYGHDPTVFAGAGNVTKTNYGLYRALRDAHGHGTRPQGVGPVQLTYVGFQDQADAAGGCWRPLVNMKIGFHSLAQAIRREGLRPAIVAYNGSGPRAEAYANTVLGRANEYAVRLRLPRVY